MWQERLGKEGGGRLQPHLVLKPLCGQAADAHRRLHRRVIAAARRRTPPQLRHEAAHQGFVPQRRLGSHSICFHDLQTRMLDVHRSAVLQHTSRR